MNVFYEIIKESWHIFLDVSVYMLFGFLVAGILHVFFKAEKIKKYLGTGKVKPVFLSALMGIPIPLCSCGVVPVALGLKKQGANNGAALSFMIATPESGVDSIAVSYAMLDPVLTVVRPLAGFFTAVCTGLAQNFFGDNGDNNEPPPSLAPSSLAVEKNQGCGCAVACNADLPETSTLSQRLMAGLKYAYGDLLTDIAKPFVIGIFIAGLITFFFPDDLSLWSNDHPFLSMGVMLVAGIPMYVCATSSTPIAAALILKGLNPGAALVFLLAGPATNAATIAIVKNMFNFRALVIYLSMIAACSLAMGVLVDWIYAFLGIKAQVVVGQASELIPYSVQLASALILAALILYNFLMNLKPRPSHSPSH